MCQGGLKFFSKLGDFLPQASKSACVFSTQIPNQSLRITTIEGQACVKYFMYIFSVILKIDQVTHV